MEGPFSAAAIAEDRVVVALLPAGRDESGLSDRDRAAWANPWQRCTAEAGAVENCMSL